MPDNSFKITVVFSKPLLLQLVMLYIRKRLISYAVRYLVVILILVGAFIEETLVRQRLAGIVYLILAQILCAFMMREYRQIKASLEKVYGIQPPCEVEYAFTGDQVTMCVNRNQTMLDMKTIKKVFVSRQILMFITSKRRMMSFPTYVFNRDQRQFLIERLTQMDVISERKIKLLNW